MYWRLRCGDYGLPDAALPALQQAGSEPVHHGRRSDRRFRHRGRTHDRRRGRALSDGRHPAPWLGPPPPPGRSRLGAARVAPLPSTASPPAPRAAGAAAASATPTVWPSSSADRARCAGGVGVTPAPRRAPPPPSAPSEGRSTFTAPAGSERMTAWCNAFACCSNCGQLNAKWICAGCAAPAKLTDGGNHREVGLGGAARRGRSYLGDRHVVLGRCVVAAPGALAAAADGRLVLVPCPVQLPPPPVGHHAWAYSAQRRRF